MPDRRAILRSFAAAPLLPGLAMLEARPLAMERTLPISRTSAIGKQILWRRVMDDHSFERFRFELATDGPSLTGQALIAEAGIPLGVDYLVRADEAWRTRDVEVHQSFGDVSRRLKLTCGPDLSWTIDGRNAPALNGCTDVDLGISPSTNALPIRRLGLSLGGTARIRAAWVRFPDLTVVAADQSYTRIAERRYRYRSLASGFQADIDIDEDGFPIDYHGIWQRIAEGPLPASSRAPSADFASALVAGMPASELGEAADDWAWIIGGWEGEMLDISPDGQMVRNPGEWWFSWIWGGRAIQDVIIAPSRAAQKDGQVGNGPERAGSTIRTFDRKAGVWRITFLTPNTGVRNQLAGRRKGDQVVLIGEEDGKPIRWTFNDITDASFIWRGEVQEPSGRWRQDAEFRLKRIAASYWRADCDPLTTL